MKIGIFGAGNVGGALGTGWARKGHEVFFGVPKPTDQDARTPENDRRKLPRRQRR